MTLIRFRAASIYREQKNVAPRILGKRSQRSSSIDDIQVSEQGPNSDDVEMKYAFDGSVTLAHQLAITAPSSPTSSPSLPSSPLAQKSMTGVSFPLLRAAKLRIHTPPPRSVIPKKSHRV